MPPIRLELLGTFRITCGDTPVVSVNTARMQSLLAYLVLHADAPQSREHLAYLLWPESEESQARTNLRQVLHHLRRALPADCSALTAEHQTVQWQRGPDCAADVFEFESALARAAQAAQRGDLAAERGALEEAARLYQDDLLRNLYDEWLAPKREDLRGRLLEVLRRLVLLLEQVGDYPGAIQHADRLVAQDPMAEANYQLLMRLHNLNQDRASAVRVYHQCMRVLKRELGLIPGAATRELFGQILKAGPPAAPSSGRPPSPADAAPMIGRKKEWERLVESWRMASEAGLHLTLITGEPGIGKSRLAEELRQWCSHADGSVARARCYASQGRLAYAPIAEWMREPPLRDALSLLPKAQLAELARVVPELLAEIPDLSPPPFTEGWQKWHLYEALRVALSGAAKPLLLLIDDLQWCDSDSFEWLHWVFRTAPSERILMLGTVRLEETGREHPLAGLVRELRISGQVEEIALEALSADETGALAAQVAKRPLDPEQREQLYERTRGNPLFVVETVQAQMGKHGQVLPQAPQKVHAVITARLAQLSSSAFELAGFASVVGRSFSFDLLAAATDWDEDSLARALEELWQRRIIEGHGAQAYDFTHDRLREVAYSELSPVRRRFLHRRIARALEEIHATERVIVSTQLAAHYEAAGMAQEAIKNYQDAAGLAQQRFADGEAAGLMRRALALCAGLPESARRDAHELESLIRLGASLLTTQGYAAPEVVQTYERALQLARRLGESGHLSSALAGVWIFRAVGGAIAAAREVALECLELAHNQADEGLLMTGHFLVGSSAFHMSQLQSSRRHLELALTADASRSDRTLHLLGGPDLGVFCRSYLAHVLWHLGYPDTAARISDQALALATEKSHPFSMAIALDYAALLHLFCGEDRLALARAEQAAAVCRQYDFPYYLAMAETVAGWAKGMEDRPAEGLAQLKSAIEALRATGAELRLPLYNGLLAQVSGRMGQTGQALADLAAGYAFQNKNGETWVAAELHRIQGDLLKDAGNVKEAHASYLRGLAAAREIKALMVELRTAVRICRLPLPQRKFTEARAMLKEIYSRFTEGFETAELEQARCLLEPSSRTG